MMNVQIKNLILGILLTTITGCEKNPTIPEPVNPAVSDSLSTVIVYFEDKRKDPHQIDSSNMHPYIKVSEDNHEPIFEKRYFEFVNNKAVLDSIPPGKYMIRVSYSAQYSYIVITNDIVVEGGKTIETRLVIPKEFRLKVKLVNRDLGDEEFPFIGVELRTEPETVTLITDEEGRADFGTVPFATYVLFITKNDFHPRRERLHYDIKNGIIEEVILARGLMPPLIEIISPEDNRYQHNFDIHLIGDGKDFEDDTLPDSSFAWFSNIDGELGKGRELIIPRLNIGIHTITLVVTDSHNIQSERSVSLNLSLFNDDSYFPLPYTGYWKYRYETADFTVTDEIKGIEHWTLNDLHVTAENIDTRNCIMEYAINRGDTTKFCRYIVVDHYETDANKIYITKTTEQMQIFENENTSAEPIEQLDIETVYSPRYLLIKQYMNPEIESSYETSGIVETTWEYSHANSIKHSLTESVDISTFYEIGQSETIETGIGTYYAVPLIIRSEDTERTWWLAKGVGIIRLTYDSFDFPLTATLYDTNVFSFTEKSHAQKISKTSFWGNSHRKTLNALPESLKRMVKFSKILKGLCPR
jgi:hypothetical protein